MLVTSEKLAYVRQAGYTTPTSKRRRIYLAHAEEPERQGVRERMPYSYNSSDGRRKATLEDAFVESRATSGAAQIEHNTGMANAQPWNLGWQVSERNLMWNDGLAAKLLKV